MLTAVVVHLDQQILMSRVMQGLYYPRFHATQAEVLGILLRMETKKKHINSFLANVAILYPMITQENPVFWCFQEL